MARDTCALGCTSGEEESAGKYSFWRRLAEDGNMSSTVVLLTSVVLGLALGLALPTDSTLPSAIVLALVLSTLISPLCFYDHA